MMSTVFKMFFLLLDGHPILAVLVLLIGIVCLLSWLFYGPVWQDHEGNR